MATRDETIKLSLIDGVTKNLASIRDGVSGVGAQLAKLNQVAELASKGFGLISSAVEGIGGSVVAVGNLEAALARVSDITSATAAEQVALQEAVNNAVSTLGVTAEQAAGALLLMAEDGFSASEAVGSLSTVLAFAKANAQDAATATQALGGVLDTFGEKPAIIAQLADQLTAASRAAGVGTVTLQNGLAAIGVQAEQAGLGVSEATAALAALASRGIEGTQAAKQLGTVLTELNNPASKAGKALDEAGLKGKSFAEIVDILSKDAAKAAPILEALGNRPRAALKVLLDDGGGALREFNAIVADAGNASADAAAKIDETFNGALARLQATIGNLRNQFLAPILQPLADEFAKVSEKLNGLADSPQFARIRDQFAVLATNVIQSVGTLVENIDLEQVAEDISDFGVKAKSAFDSLVIVVETTAGAIKDVADAIDAVRTANENFLDAIGANNDQVTKFIERQRALRAQSKEVGDAFDEAAKFVDKFSGLIFRAGNDSATAGAKLNKLSGDSVVAADGLNKVADAAKPAGSEIAKTADEVKAAAIAFERVQIGTFLRAMNSLRDAGLQNTETYKALNKEFLAAEERINSLNKANKSAAETTQQVGEKADSAADSLRNYANAAANVRASSEQISESADRIEESFNRASDAAERVSETVTTLTVAVSELDSASARADSSAGQGSRLFIESINRRTAANRELLDALDLRLERERQIAAQGDELAQMEAQLAQQYGGQSEKIRELAELIDANNKRRQEAIELTERETAAIVRNTAAQVGALGATQSALTAAPTGSAAGRGGTSSGGGGRSGETPTIVVNVSGAPTDAAGWRDIVSRFIAPELQRIDRLSR